MMMTEFQCKIGCYHFAGFEEINDEAFHKGRRFYDSMLREPNQKSEWHKLGVLLAHIAGCENTQVVRKIYARISAHKKLLRKIYAQTYAHKNYSNEAFFCMMLPIPLSMMFLTKRWRSV